MPKNRFQIIGINENNLKNVDFDGALGEIVTVCGVSGSGKSTLVNSVIATEAHRQNRLRRQSDVLYDYCVRPNFISTTELPNATIVSQRGFYLSKHSTFGTRTKLNELITRLFVSNGEIIHNGKKLQRPTRAEAVLFRNNYSPTSSLFFAVSRYETIATSALNYLQKQQINTIFLRKFGEQKLIKTSLTKLKKLRDSEKYEVFTDEKEVPDDDKFKNNWPLFLLNDNQNINLNEHALSQEDGNIFRLPSTLLFSRSTQSSLAGYCRECEGEGSLTRFNIAQHIQANVQLDAVFLDIPQMPSGRYRGLKFLPTGLTQLLKKKGIDVTKTWQCLSEEEKSVVLKILLDKLKSNKSDDFVQAMTEVIKCDKCSGSGLSDQARAVTVKGKTIDFYLSLTPLELLDFLDSTDFSGIQSIRDISNYLVSLSLGHLPLHRTTEQLSSGERQRVKLLPLLVNKVENRIVIVDEPSSNLQYKDNLKIIDLLTEIRDRNNCVIVVDHNPMYQVIANRVLNVGPEAGVNGGFIRWVKPPTTLKADYFQVETAAITHNQQWLTIKLEPCRNLNLSQLRIPENMLNVIVGASGTGKTTLLRDMIFPSLNKSNLDIEIIDSNPVHHSKRSIVATWIDVFDEVRAIYSKNSLTHQPPSFFSFNSLGGCEACGGDGITDDEQICGVCLGGRFKSDVLLETVEGINISELIKICIDDLPVQGSFNFLSNVVTIFKALSLSHLSLGRATSTLSGGELQRLKIAKILLRGTADKKQNQKIFLLDEPSQGLDEKAVISLVEALKHFLASSTLVVIEHNPNFIYSSDFVIDLGLDAGLKNDKDIYCGFVAEKIGLFPSLNHNQVLASLNQTKKESIVKRDSSIDVDIEESEMQRKLGSKRLHLLPHFILEQNNFEFERIFSQNASVKKSIKELKFYRKFSDLKKAVEKLEKFYFNPFVPYLERFKIVPNSIQKLVLRDAKINKSTCDDEWDFVLLASSFEEAWVKGGGVLIEKSDAGYTYHALRVFAPSMKIADRLHPHKSIFNLYKNSCDYCHGYGHIQSYPLERWLDKSKSILDKGVMPFAIEKVMPKSTIKHFLKEGLFDFTRPIKDLSNNELLILLYGFKAYRFPKSGKAQSQSDFYEWRGINSYLYHQSKKLSPNVNLDDKIRWITCPFCVSGFDKNINNYELDGQSFVEYINGSS